MATLDLLNTILSLGDLPSWMIAHDIAISAVEQFTDLLNEKKSLDSTSPVYPISTDAIVVPCDHVKTTRSRKIRLDWKAKHYGKGCGNTHNVEKGKGNDIDWNSPRYYQYERSDMRNHNIEIEDDVVIEDVDAQVDVNKIVDVYIVAEQYICDIVRFYEAQLSMNKETALECANIANAGAMAAMNLRDCSEDNTYLDVIVLIKRKVDRAVSMQRGHNAEICQLKKNISVMKHYLHSINTIKVGIIESFRVYDYKEGEVVKKYYYNLPRSEGTYANCDVYELLDMARDFIDLQLMPCN